MRTFPVSTTPTQNPVKDITHLFIHPPTTPRRHTSPTARQHTLRTCCPPGPCQKVSGRKSTNPHSFRAEDRSTCRRRASAARPGGAPPPCGVESLGAAPQRRWCSTWVFVSEGGGRDGMGPTSCWLLALRQQMRQVGSSEGGVLNFDCILVLKPSSGSIDRRTMDHLLYQADDLFAAMMSFLTSNRKGLGQRRRWSEGSKQTGASKKGSPTCHPCSGPGTDAIPTVGPPRRTCGAPTPCTSSSPQPR